MNILRWLPFGKVPEVTPTQLNTGKNDFQMIDVRSVAEFQADHIDGAVNLPITQFSSQALQTLELDRQKPVVAICLSAHRSIPAVRYLRDLGFDGYQLAGGMKAWWKYQKTN